MASPVASTMRCTASVLGDLCGSTWKPLERLDSVVWSGALNLRSRSLKIEASSPSVCRQGSLNSSRKAIAASIATSE